MWPVDVAPLFLDSAGLGGAEKRDTGNHVVDGDQRHTPPPPDRPSLPTPPMCGSLLQAQVEPDSSVTEVVVVDGSVGGSAGGGGLRQILFPDGDDYDGLPNKVFGSAAGGTPADDLFRAIAFEKDERLLTASELFELAAAVGLLALMPGGSSEISECAQALFERARDAKLPHPELLVLGSLPNEVMVNSLSKAWRGRNEEHGYLLTYARGLHRARKRDFFGAAKIYSSMLEDEAAWTCPEVYEDAHAFFFIPIDPHGTPEPEPMDESELAQAIQMVTPPPTI